MAKQKHHPKPKQHIRICETCGEAFESSDSEARRCHGGCRESKWLVLEDPCSYDDTDANKKATDDPGRSA